MSAYSPPRTIKTSSDTDPPSDEAMDAAHCLLDYLETFPSEAGAVELRDQLSAFTHHDLRAACSRLNLSMPKRQNKKGGYISALVSYWLALPSSTQSTPVAEVTPPTAQAKNPVSKPATTKPVSKPATKKIAGMELPADVAQFVQLFPPHGHVEALRTQLKACRARTLRSACVLLDLHPRKSFIKGDFLRLLVNYWQDSSAGTPRAAAATLEPETEIEMDMEMETDADVDGDVVVPSPMPSPPVVKRARARDDDVKKVIKKKTKKSVEAAADGERRGAAAGDGVAKDDDKKDKWAASLEKANVVKEWASAIEILSRVDGSAESIESIRSLIDGVVNNATSEL